MYITWAYTMVRFKRVKDNRTVTVIWVRFFLRWLVDQDLLRAFIKIIK
jgi:hypothetical protein